VAEFIQRIPEWDLLRFIHAGGGLTMAAPRKPKAAGVRTGKSTAKAATGGAAAKPKVAAPAANGNGTVAAPSAEMIRLRAYEVFAARGGTGGDELSDWLTAEREIMEKSAFHD
jgi:hypothetical protein